jgi:hypothetical protein
MSTGSHVLVYKVNKQLKAALKNKNNITYWEHRGMWKNTANLMCPKKNPYAAFHEPTITHVMSD